MREIHWTTTDNLQDFEHVAERIGEKPTTVASVIETVIEQQFWRQSNDNVDYNSLTNRYANVSHNMLKRIHRRAPKTIRKLKGEGILLRDGLQINGEKAYGYKFHRKHWGNLQPWTFDVDSVHHHTKQSILGHKTQNSFDAPDKYSDMAEHVFDYEIDSDILSDPDIQGKRLKFVLDSVNGKRHFKQTGFAGRIYSSFSNLPETARKYVSVDGHSDLTEIDLSCSQPFLFSALVLSRLDCLFHTCCCGGGCGGVIGGSIKTHGNYTQYTKAQVKRSTKEFLSLIKEDDIYIDAKKKLDHTYKRDHGRDFFKPKVLMLFNETNENIQAEEFNSSPQTRSRNRLRDLENAYAKEYGPTWSVLQSLRDAVKEQFNTSVGDWLNQFETDVMVDTVAQKVAREDVPILTIHDCVVVPTENAEEVEDRIHSAFTEKFGVAPNTTKERLS